jgi:DNA topoisomerase-1
MSQETPFTDTPQAAAKKAGLRYVTDSKPGFTRKKSGKSWQYFDTEGKKITDKEIIERINKIGIPPAYSDVWICPQANGHIQATGMDERGRKQYRYHVDWSEARKATKFDRMKQFGEALPKIRRQVGAHLNQPGISKEKVLATLVHLLERTLIRVGNEEYAKENKSYGLTTMQNKHVDIDENEIKFTFKGKSNKYHEITLRDKKLAKIVRELQDLPGQDLFQYLDDDHNLHEIHSDDINEYIQEITGQEFTAKDFRTWKGTVLASLALLKFDPAETEAEVKRNLAEAVKQVSSELGNTPAVCRKAYIHPSLLQRYLEAKTLQALQEYTPEQLEKYKLLRQEEAIVMVFMEGC